MGQVIPCGSLIVIIATLLPVDTVRHRTTALVVLVGVVLLSTVLIADSPYRPTRHSDRNPFAPERPATFNRTTATSYLIDYEQTRLYNDLLGSRGYTIDDGDDLRADCAVDSVQRSNSGFQVELRCEGEITDVYRLIHPTKHSYTVTYLITENSLEELAIQDYPFSQETSSVNDPSQQNRYTESYW